MQLSRAYRLWMALALLLLSRVTEGQGVSGGAIQGIVADTSGSPVPGADITLLNTSTGYRHRATSNAHGRFTFEYLAVGGPYTLIVRALRFAPRSISGIMLHLDARLHEVVVLDRLRLLDTIAVVASRIESGMSGPAHSIPGSLVRALPLPRRDFVALLAAAPQATGPTLSVSGQHPRFNTIQIDGGTASDIFGTNATPGANSGARALSVEAIEEVHVLVAPFDVRYGGFSGGLVNAVTRSGTNELHASVFTSFASARFVGTDTSGLAIADFASRQYGLRASGPIVRDRLHYFLVAELQADRSPFSGPAVNDPSVGISDTTVIRARNAMVSQYGFDPGGAESPVFNHPGQSAFGKLSWQAAPAHLAELSVNWVHARKDTIARMSFNRNDRDGWQLSNSGQSLVYRNLTTRLKVVSSIGSFANELIVSRATYESDVASQHRVPLFLVQDRAASYLAAGSVKGAQGTETDQDIVEVTDNLTWSRGSHLVTIGTQNQRAHIRDTFFSGSWGTWTFGSVDSLERNLPLRYEAALPQRPGGPLASFSVLQASAYVEDRWTIGRQLVVAAGLRYDVPLSDAPPRNESLATNAMLGRIDTHAFPSGNGVLSPRVSFAYEPGSSHRWLIRGGGGGFSGRVPYAWLSTAFANTGAEQRTLICAPVNGVPRATSNVDALPTSCTGAGAAATARPTVSYFTPDFRFPQTLKLDLGLEHRFATGMTLSLDAMYVAGRNAPYLVDANLMERGMNAEGRTMYGTLANAGTRSTPTPARRDTTYGPVYRFENRSADRSFALSAELQRTWTNGMLQLGYNWSRSEDLTSMSNFNGPLILQNNPLDGSMAARQLRTSLRDVPHNLVLTVVSQLGLGMTGSAMLRARSGLPYAYVVLGDANIDGIAGNDLSYIPRDSADANLSNPSAYRVLDAFIQSEACLRAQRGQIMARASCRNPAVAVIDAHLARPVRIGGARGVEVSLDIFNGLNLLNRNWGLVRETSATGRETLNLLTLYAFDSGTRPLIYTVPAVLPGRAHVNTELSRWRMQLGARVEM